MENYLAEIAVGIIALWLGSIEARMKGIGNQMAKTPNRDEMDKMIELKQEVLKAIQKDIKEDIRELSAKLDRLIELGKR